MIGNHAKQLRYRRLQLAWAVRADTSIAHGPPLISGFAGDGPIAKDGLQQIRQPPVAFAMRSTCPASARYYRYAKRKLPESVATVQIVGETWAFLVRGNSTNLASWTLDVN